MVIIRCRPGDNGGGSVQPPALPSLDEGGGSQAQEPAAAVQAPDEECAGGDESRSEEEGEREPGIFVEPGRVPQPRERDIHRGVDEVGGEGIGPEDGEKGEFCPVQIA